MGYQGMPYQYQGQCDAEGKKCGFGRWTYNANNIYEGMWKDDKQNGFGRFIYNNGGHYVGEYRDGHRYGSGVLIDANGKKLDKIWAGN
jgi:hypothetical protein